MRNNMTRPVLLLVVIAIVVIAWITMRRPSGCISESDARTAATKRIQEYAPSDNLVVAAFGSPDVSRADQWWQFDFASNSKPRHLVTVLVYCDGHSELSRSIRD